MKRVWCGALALMAVLMMLSLPAAAAEILEERTHRDWSSFVVATSSDAVARMTTMQDETMLAIDIEPDPSERSWSIKMLENISPEDSLYFDMAGSFSLYGQMRVDRGRIYDVQFNLHAQDDVLIIEMLGQFHETFLREASQGSVLRVKVDETDPLYLRFSLQGFTAALERCTRLADILAELPSDRDFFEDAEPDGRFFKDPEPARPRERIPGIRSI